MRSCVGFAVDEAYALPLAVVGRSLIDHHADLHAAGEKLEFVVLDLGISERSRGRLAAAWSDGASVDFLRLPSLDELDGLPLSDHEFVPHLNRNVYGRWFLPELLPPVYRRMIYLDADVLVLGDTSTLWRVGLGGHPFAAAQDKGIPFVSSPYGVPDHRELGFDARARYFNAGVMVIDLDRWKAQRVRERALAYARAHPAMRFADQEALNAVAGGRWAEFPQKWNCPAEDEVLDEEYGARPRIIHFLGPGKPWLGGSHATRCQALYGEYLRRTGWPPDGLG
ncbi:glycosyltransferase [Streptomyces sp. NPDC008121]|uniref:glycosyltransferase family 8 protein n=1 Tax=Streptomyces sp. NPDC008121 TaxID=3364809 RepID=UPI0036DFDBE4